MIQTCKFWLAALTLVCLAGGCASSAPPANPVALTTLAWPKAPEQARVKYRQSVAGPLEWGVDLHWWQKLFNALTGAGAQRFVRPSAVAEAGGVLYVADPGAQSLWLLDRPHQSIRQITQVNGDALRSPVALALRDDGAVFLADSALNKVFLLGRDGALLRIIANPALARPVGVAWSEAKQQLYVLDSKRHRITVFDQEGNLLRHFGERGNGNGQFNHPTHLTLAADGSLLITDAMNFRVQGLSPTGDFLWQFGHHGDGSGDFAAPKGLAVDSDGHYYVVDALFDTVQVFTRDGQLLFAFGDRGAQPGEMALPRGIFISKEDTVYVADAFNQRVQVFMGIVATRKEQAK